jgi:hypothetical protein
MQQSTQEKDSEIFKLNMYLAGEKRKGHETFTNPKGLNSSASYRSHSQETRHRFEPKGQSPQVEYNFENTGILGMSSDNFVSTQKYLQLKDDHELIETENKQLKKKNDTLRHKLKDENFMVKSFKKQIKD